MVFRFLILLFLLPSTSCKDIKQDVENQYASTFQNDDTDCDFSRDYGWFGILTSDGTPVFRTVSRQRTSQRNFEKRKIFFDFLTGFSSENNTFKYFKKERRLYCHLVKSGRSLLNFICKLSC